MRKSFKGRLALGLAVTLTAGMLAGCAGSSSQKLTSAEATNEANNTTVVAETTVTENTAPETTEAEKTELTFSAGQVAMGGGGFVTGLISTKESGVYYARTDVGGAYRWDKAANKWISLSYDITEKDRGLLGVDGLAVDPNDASKIYMICATSYFSGGKTCIFVSEDYGENFERVDVSNLIKNNGNGMGRQNGERIAVDPSDSKHILAGGRTGGIIESKDGGKTWAAISFPVTSTDNNNGVCSIVFSADGSKVYAAASEKGQNIYVSEDKGVTWKTIEGLPDGFMPQRMKFNQNGEMLITYSGAEGPWNGNGGGIWKYDPSTGKTTDISPDAKSFGDVVCDPTNPDKMFASTENIWSMQPNGAYGDEFYVTTDGGNTWRNILENMTMDTNGIAWIKDYAIHWVGSIMIDPVENGKIMVTSGNGVFACDDIWAEKPAFYFNAAGIEETVPLDAVSIKDGPLVTAIGDYDGFIHEDIFKYPDRFSTTIGSNASVAVAGTNTNVWVRVGNDETKFEILYSLDAGKTWTQMSNKPEGKTYGGGRVAVTADGKTIVWYPEKATNAFVTTDYGQTWTASEGLVKKTYLIADPVDSNYIYGMGADSFWVSSDGGKTFERVMRSLTDATRCAVVPGKAGTVYIAGGLNGVLLSEDYGKTTRTLENVIWCGMVSTGKGLDDNTPAIYMWGSTTDKLGVGVYMSLDNGKNWIKMNEEGVEFGGPGNGQFVVGDQNTVGRCYMSTVGLGLIYFQCEGLE